MNRAMSLSLCIVLCTVLCAVFFTAAVDFFGTNVVAEEWENEYVIRDDDTGGECYLIGTWESSTKTCTLTSDVSKTIIIDDDGIILDGDDRSIAAGSGLYGVYVSQQSDVVIKDVNVNGFEYGIYLKRGRGNTVSGSTVSDNTDFGFYLYLVYETTLTDNSMEDNSIFIGGNTIGHWNSHSIGTTNTVNGNPVYYWKDSTGGTIPSGAGQVILANCTGVLVKNQELSDGSAGILLGYSSSNSVAYNDITYQDWYGIYLYESMSNTIKENSLSHNYHGIFLSSSTSNAISENTISDNSRYGISLYYESDSNIVRENVISNNIRGFSLHTSSSNTIVENAITDNVNGIIARRYSSSNTIIENTISNNGRYGIYVNHYCSSNTVVENTISNNGRYGIYLIQYSSSNTIFHNNFVDNGNQVYVDALGNTWENGDGEGNYWSDYEGEDTDGDGIGDTELPHHGVDWYPLMDEWWT